KIASRGIRKNVNRIISLIIRYFNYQHPGCHDWSASVTRFDGHTYKYVPVSSTPRCRTTSPVGGGPSNRVVDTSLRSNACKGRAVTMMLSIGLFNGFCGFYPINQTGNAQCIF